MTDQNIQNPTAPESSKSTSPSVKRENSIVNILFNIVIPVVILNKVGTLLKLSPGITLLIALAFPVIYWVYDLVQRRKFNYISVLGFLNILLTGGLALLKVTGFWFAVKEAAFPTLIGLFVLFSAFSKSPFIQTLLLDPSLVDTEALHAKLKENNSTDKFKLLLKNATLLLSASFALSATLNFVLARRIFTEIDPQLPEEQIANTLNSQIADMTALSMPVIMVPSIIFLIVIFMYLLKGIKKLTGVSLEELLRNNK